MPRLRLFLGMLCIALLLQPAPLWCAETAAKEIAWAISYDPKTLDPAKVDDQASEQIRYLTAGVLVRLNRSTLAPEPALARAWQISADGKSITFALRPGLRFSDGTALTSADVADSLRRVLLPATEAPTAEEFLAPAKVRVATPDPLTVRVELPVRVAGLAAVFDEIAIEPAHRPSEGRITAGPFAIAEYRRGEFVRLRRNPYYGQPNSPLQAPRLESLRLDIVSNRETEQLRFLRGQYQLLDSVPPESFNTLRQRAPNAFFDRGASLNTEQMWFNQSPTAPIEGFKKKWFTSQAFRAAVSAAIRRQDLARIAFDGHATAANGFISPANRAWYNQALPPARMDVNWALQQLASAGFQKRGNQLFDRDGHPVQFSLVTNAGNRARERMAALIQQDLAALGMQVNVVRLDFPALIERLMHSGDYEAALLGLSNVQPDPSAMMNVWLSDSPNHQWNPNEKVPATPWEAEIDRAVRTQAASAEYKVRKAAMDRVQAIVAEQFPFIYLVYPNTLCAVSPELSGVQFTVLQPTVVSAIQNIGWKDSRR